MNIRNYKAIARTVDECIAEDVLREFLFKAKSEVVEMVLYEFDRELYERDLIANTREDLREEVRAEVEVTTLLENIANLQQNLNLSLEDALKALGKTMDDYNKAQTVIREKGQSL